MDVTIPEDLTTLSDDELGALRDQLVEEFDRLHDEGSADVAVLTELAEAIQAVRGEVEARETQAAEAEARIADLVNQVHPTAETDTPDPEPDPEGDEEPDEEEAPEANTEEEELVTASAARRPSARAIGSRAPRPSAPARSPEVVITAAADIPNVATGARIDTIGMAQAFHDRARGLNDGSPRIQIATVHVPIPAEHMLSESDPGHNMDVLRSATGQYTADAPALVAAGGWCAPSVPIFNLFDIGDASGLLDLPTVGGIRGGMLVPSFYGFGDVSGALWTWTEANDIAALAGTPTKPCLRIPCPTWTDYRLEAEGLCVTHGNLSDRAFPELTRQFINVVMGAHQHRLSAAKLAKIVADAITVTPAASMLVSDAAGDLLGVIELQAADMRSQYRAARTRVVDVALPDWIAPALRANMAMRAGVDFLTVTDAQVTAWLTSRGVRPQFLSDYQPLYDGTPADAWPTAVEFTMWFAGAYVEGDGGEIDLGVVRDSTLNETNDFTAAWSEQFYQVARVGPKARKVSVALTIDGVTACCTAAAA